MNSTRKEKGTYKGLRNIFNQKEEQYPPLAITLNRKLVNELLMFEPPQN